MLNDRRDPAAINWASAGAKYVVESTGVFTTIEKVRLNFLSEFRHNVQSLLTPFQLLLGGLFVKNYAVIALINKCEVISINDLFFCSPVM